MKYLKARKIFRIIQSQFYNANERKISSTITVDLADMKMFNFT